MTRVLLFILLILFLGRAVMRLLSGIVDGATGGAGRAGAIDRGVQMVRDPVCGTFVVPSRALSLVEGDRIAYFCSERCRSAYHAAPGAKTARQA